MSRQLLSAAKLALAAFHNQTIELDQGAALDNLASAVKDAEERLVTIKFERGGKPIAGLEVMFKDAGHIGGLVRATSELAAGFEEGSDDEETIDDIDAD